MSATNSTPTINLPLFIGTDKPAWLTDWNGSMNAIDSAIATLQTAEGGTATALASLSQSVTALSGTVEQHTTAIQTVTTATATNTGSINTITSLIGNGEPTTTDKTIIGAINEIYADIGAGDGVDADEVNYDNTSSGLTATDVQAAIDEVNGKIPSITTPDAEDVSYDNTQSGLTASNVQAAIDELAAQPAGGLQLAGTSTGSTPVDISSVTATEFIVVVRRGTSAVYATYDIPAAILDNTDRNFVGGQYVDNSTYWSASVRATSASIFMSSVKDGSSDVLSTSQISVYYR